jgi:hypothetical protein
MVQTSTSNSHCNTVACLVESDCLRLPFFVGREACLLKMTRQIISVDLYTWATVLADRITEVLRAICTQ